MIPIVQEKMLHNCASCPVGIYLLKLNDGNTKTVCEICPKLTMKTTERRQWHCSDVFIVNIEQIVSIVALLIGCY